MRILLVEDSHDLAANVGEYLEGQGEVVDFAGDGLTGLHLAATRSYEVMVLDISLPGVDGLTLCRRLREDARSGLPVLMLTARDTERDKLRGFDAGADDYLTKPFSLPELHARLKALTRRAAGGQSLQLRVADLAFDPRTLIARRGQRRLDLTPSGLRLLGKLMHAAPGVVGRADIIFTLWGDDPPGSEAALRAHIHALRVAIDQGESVKLLRTVHGIGYTLCAEDA